MSPRRDESSLGEVGFVCLEGEGGGGGGGGGGGELILCIIIRC